MTATDPASIPDNTYEELVQATLTALYKNGYVNLRVKDIDAEFEKSRQLIHHYFDGKDELITETLAFLIESIDNNLDSTTNDDPAKKLDDEIDRALLRSEQDNENLRTIITALYELQPQARHNPHHQEFFNQVSDRLVEHFTEIIQDGIERDVFNDVDARQMATAIDDLIAVGQMKMIHLDRDDAPIETREMIDELVIARLNPTQENSES